MKGKCEPRATQEGWRQAEERKSEGESKQMKGKGKPRATQERLRQANEKKINEK